MASNESRFGITLTLAVITTVLSIGGSVLVSWLTTKSPDLTYAQKESPAIKTERGYKRIVLIEVRNLGRREVQALLIGIEAQSGVWEDTAFEASQGIPLRETKESTRYSIQTDNFNPTERITLSGVLVSPQETPEYRTTIRGNGVVGIRAKDDTFPVGTSPYKIALATVLIVFWVGLTVAVLLARNRSKFIGQVASFIDRASPIPGFLPIRSRPSRSDKRTNIAYVLERCGLYSISERLRFTNADTSYMGAADVIYLKALRGDAGEKQRCLVALKCLLLVSHLAQASKAVVLRHVRSVTSKELDAQELAEIEKKAVDPDDFPKEFREQVDALLAREGISP